MTLRESITKFGEQVEAFEENRLPSSMEFAVFSKEKFPVPYGFVLKTERGLGLLDWLANLRWDWDRQNDAGTLSLMLLGAIGSLFLLWFAVNSAALDAPTAVHQPENLFIIPGVNDFLPMVTLPYLLFAVGLSMFIHELGHGIAARRIDVEVEHWGLFFLTILPAGAYVAPDHDAAKERSPRERLQFFSAGVMNNAILGVIALGLFAYVTPASAAEAFAFTGSDPTEAIKHMTAHLSPASNTFLWLAMLNLNLAILNAIPIYPMDGGHVLGAVLELVGKRFPLNITKEVASKTVKATSYSLFGLFLLGMVIPHV